MARRKYTQGFSYAGRLNVGDRILGRGRWSIPIASLARKGDSVYVTFENGFTRKVAASTAITVKYATPVYR